MKNINELIKHIYLKSPFQKKSLEKHLNKQNKEFIDSFENTLIHYLAAFKSHNVSLESIASSYVEMCNDTLIEQIKFSKKGEYSLKSFEDAAKTVYHNKEKMTPYMIGLMASLFLWENHYEMFHYFKKNISTSKDSVERYLEIGAGHGLYLCSAIENFGKINYDVIDISETSLEMTKTITSQIYKNNYSVTFHLMDFLTYPEIYKYDYITMGEVLEHVENPKPFLEKIRSLLNSNGKAYITTCSNCPAIDHIYLFNNITEIQNMIISAGFKILSELALETQTVAKKESNNTVGHNYAAIIQPSN